MVSTQVFDNALIAAGLMDDPRVMLARLNSLLEHALNHVPTVMYDIKIVYMPFYVDLQ